jgi:hypothetical protein
LANGETNGMNALHSVLMLGEAHFGPTPFKVDAAALNTIATSLRGNASACDSICRPNSHELILI